MSEFDDKPRRSFTPHWDEAINRTEALPIKFGGKIVPNYKNQFNGENETIRNEEAAIDATRSRSKNNGAVNI